MKIGKQVLQAFLLFVSHSTALGAVVEYSTSVDVYLDPSTSGGANLDDTRWEISSAVSQQTAESACIHRRDFIFTCGWYLDAGGTGSPGWTCSASNNSVGNPNSNSPFTLPQQAGWYTFRHVFNDVAGVLSVDFEILDENGTLLNTWTRSNPADGIDDPVVGNRYGWFVRLGCTGLCTGFDDTFKLPIDNTQKCIQNSGCDFFQGFEDDIDGWLEFSNSGITQVPSGTGGITSASGNFHAEAVPGDGNTGPFTRWNGYCTFDFPSDAPSSAPSQEPFCQATCDVPLKVTGTCDLDVLLECDLKTKASGKGRGKGKSMNVEMNETDIIPSVFATVKCDCADVMSMGSPSDENFCLSLQGELCNANLDVVGTSGTISCDTNDISYTLKATIPDEDSKSGKGKGRSRELAHDVCESTMPDDNKDPRVLRRNGKGKPMPTLFDTCEL